MRCHPYYHKKPWYDCVEVTYNQGGDQLDLIPSRLQLWLTFIINAQEKMFYALIHSDLPQVFQMDRLFKEIKIVSYHDSITGPSFVLPGIHRLSNS